MALMKRPDRPDILGILEKAKKKAAREEGFKPGSSQYKPNKGNGVADAPSPAPKDERGFFEKHFEFTPPSSPKFKQGLYTADNTPSFEPEGAWQRTNTTGVVRGAGAGLAAGHLNAAGTLLDLFQNKNSYTAGQRKEIESHENAIKQYEKLWNQTHDVSKRLKYERAMKQHRNAIRAINDLIKTEQKHTQKGVDVLQGAADRMAQTSQQENALAKEGLSKAGQMAVDVGTAGLQMGADALTGGLPAMFVRSAGSAAQQARQAGADLDAQALYGLGSGALSVATEKIANVAAPFKKAFGPGLAETMLPNVVNRLSSTKLGKLALSALSEGGEEFVEDIFQPVLQRATYDPNARFNLESALYDAAIGAVLGGVGSAGEIAVNLSESASAAPKTAEKGDGKVQRRRTGETSVTTPHTENALRGATNANQSGFSNGANANANAVAPGEEGYRPTLPIFKNRTPIHESQLSQSVRSASKSRGALMDILQGGKRVDQAQVSNEDFNAMVDRSDIAMDADQRVYKVDPAQHIDVRTDGQISDRRVNAFQFDHPELKDYYTPMAQTLLTELDGVVPGGQTVSTVGENGPYSWRTKRSASPRIAKLLDSGMNKDRIAAALDAIIQDHGAENKADAKRVEMVIDDMLTNGYSDGTQFVSANEQYVADKNNIVGNRGAERGHGLDDIDTDTNVGSNGAATEEYTAPGQNPSIGAADQGFTTPGEMGQEQTSRLADSTPFTEEQERATGLSKEQYDQLFRYRSQTEGRSMNLADEMLYMEKDGQRTFLADIDPDAFREMIRSLDDATAWNAPQMDAAHMIQTELQTRAADGQVSQEDYVEWLRIMREHDTSTGQGVQAGAKWATAGQSAGSQTELEAWNNLEKSKLSEPQKKEIFQKIVEADKRISSVPSGDVAGMADIIMEVGRERGVFTGSLTGRESRWMEHVVRKSLDGLSFDQLKSMAYASTSALSTDHNPVDIGRRMKTVQMLNMLSNPKTPTKNVTGNTAFAGIDALSMNGAALMDMALSKLTGTRSVAFQGMNGEGRRAALDALRLSAAEIALDVDMGAAGRYGTGSTRTFKANSNSALERLMSVLERNNSFALTMPDEFFKGIARGTEKATQDLVNSGKIKTDSETYAKDQADALAKFRTFQDSSRMSTIIQTAHDLFNILPGFGDSGRKIGGITVHSFGVGDLVAPFTKVAGNLVTRGIEYSPFNAAKGVVEMVDTVYQAKHNNSADPAKQAHAVSDFARGMSGTAIVYGFAVLAKLGLLKLGNDEDDKDVAALNSSEGVYGVQLNISAAKRALSGGSLEWQEGDRLMDLASFEPFNILMDMGVSAAKWDEDTTLTGKARDVSDSLIRASADMPVAGTMGSIYKDVALYGNDVYSAVGENLGKTAISSVLPNVVRATAKGLDDRPRSIYNGDTVGAHLTDYAKNSIPGLRQTLPGSVNALGQDKVYADKGAHFMNAVINPVGLNIYAQGKTSKIMEDIRNKTDGRTDFYPHRSAPATVSYKDEKGKSHAVPLSKSQKQDYLKKCGTTFSRSVEIVSNLPKFKKAKPGKQADYLATIKAYSEAMADVDAAGTKAAPSWMLNAKNARKDLNMSTEELLMWATDHGTDDLSGASYDNLVGAVQHGLTMEQWTNRMAQADTDGNGSLKQAEARSWLDKQPDLSRKQKGYLWTLMNKSWKRNPYN